MMIIAIPIWKGRVSPVLDFSNEIMFVDSNAHQVIAQQRILNHEASYLINTLKNFDTQMLVCGAISREYYALITHAEIEIVPCVRASLEEILFLIKNNRINELPLYAQPGGQRRRCRGGKGGRGGRGRNC